MEDVLVVVPSVLPLSSSQPGSGIMAGATHSVGNDAMPDAKSNGHRSHSNTTWINRIYVPKSFLVVRGTSSAPARSPARAGEGARALRRTSTQAGDLSGWRENA